MGEIHTISILWSRSIPPQQANVLRLGPWTQQEIGDFQVFYNFPELGSYQIVLSVAKDGNPVNPYSIDPPRTTLSSNTDCNCDRAIFNVSITENLGSIWNAMMIISISLPLSVIGGVLVWNYRRMIKSGKYPKSAERHCKVYHNATAIAGGACASCSLCRACIASY